MKIIFIIIFLFVLRETKYGELPIENTGILHQPPMIFDSYVTRDHLEKFGTIPDPF
jgi:hypothetical protein